jgi:Mrp family chromosome partitioning ATPase
MDLFDEVRLNRRGRRTAVDATLPPAPSQAVRLAAARLHGSDRTSDGHRSLLCTGVESGSDLSGELAWWLARALADLGHDVLFVDARHQSPLKEQLGQPVEPLVHSGVTSQDGGAEQDMRPVPMRELGFVAPGMDRLHFVGIPRALLAVDAAQSTGAVIEQSGYDWTVVTAGVVSEDADAARLAEMTADTLIVVTLGRDRFRSFVRTRRLCGHLGVRVRGVVPVSR